VKGLFALVALLPLLTGMTLVNVTDASISAADTTILNNNVNVSVGEVDDADYATATTATTMTGIPSE
jgi:hypothetical protein